ncbi:MAG: hypothetical protein Q7R65_01075, partial [bacterium]|nr:hypothetical protein [bacterium]
NMMIVQVLQVFARKYWLHFLRQFFGVVASNTEGNDATDIPKDGVLNTIGQLVEILVCEVKIQAVFTGFGEDRRKNVSRFLGDHYAAIETHRIRSGARYCFKNIAGTLRYSTRYCGRKTKKLV